MVIAALTEREYESVAAGEGKQPSIEEGALPLLTKESRRAEGEPLLKRTSRSSASLTPSRTFDSPENAEIGFGDLKDDRLARPSA